MSLILQPQKSFTVVRQIANHLDTDVLYVRAVIRNAYTDEIIDTLDLTDRGSQRFSKNWRVPADPSGEGFYVSIVTSVYSDSGYTTKNQSYGDEENTYLVQERNLPLMRGGGGGIDARTVRRIIQEELAKLEEKDENEPEEVGSAPETPQTPQMRWDEVLGAVSELKEDLKSIPTDKTDLTPVLSSLSGVLKSIQDKEVTPPTDLTDLTSQVQQLVSDLNDLETLLSQRILESEKEITNSVTESIKTQLPALITEAVKGVSFTIAPSTATMNTPEPKKEEEEVIDLSAIAT